jgi:hypothetical protein
MAQIDVSLIPEEIAPGFRPLQVLGNAWSQFLQVLQWIATGLIWALVFAPIALILAGVVVLVLRARRRRSARDAGS